MLSTVAGDVLTETSRKDRLLTKFLRSQKERV